MVGHCAICHCFLDDDFAFKLHLIAYHDGQDVTVRPLRDHGGRAYMNIAFTQAEANDLIPGLVRYQ